MRYLVILKGQMKLGCLSNSHYSGSVLELLREMKHSFTMVNMLET